MMKKTMATLAFIGALGVAAGVVIKYSPWVLASDVRAMKDEHHKVYTRLISDAAETADRAIQNEINNLNYTLINLFPALADAEKRKDQKAILWIEQKKLEIEQKIEELKAKKGTMFK